MSALTDVAMLDAHMATNSYVEGYAATQKDVAVFKAISTPAASYPHALRWYSHMSSFSAAKLTAMPGTPQKLAAAPASSSAPAPAPAPAAEKPKQEKKEKAPKAPKEKKEAPKKEEPKPAEDDAAKKAADEKKAREKLLAKVFKEGGKKGVEIEGASDMGGLDFFCTTIESPDGDLDLLELAMEGMNAQPEPDAEDRKGCSGHVGKMIFSAGVDQLALLAYVPDNEHNKSASKVDVQAWMDHVMSTVGGGSIVKKAEKAKSPMGGKIVVAKIPKDADKGKFPLKDKDSSMAAAFAFLRSKGAFPEDNDDSDDMVFGDDDCLDDY